MEARNRPLKDWMTRIRSHQIELPRFQRMEAWGHKEITDMLDAAVQDLPVGSVLILEIGGKLPFISRPVAGAPSKGERINELLLDGQQRLTAFWKALTDSYPDRSYFIEVPSDVEKEFTVTSVSRWVREGKRYPAWADSPMECWKRRYVPVSLFDPDSSAEQKLQEWIKQAEKNDITRFSLLAILARLRQRFASYNLPFLFLPVGTTKEVALDVFIKMNTRTVRLTTFDIIVAQMEEAADESLHEMVDSLSKSVPHLSAYDTKEDLVLSAMALLQDRVPNQTGYLGMDFKKMVEDWPKFVDASKRAVEFFEQEMLFDNSRLPTESILAPIIALWSFVENKPDQVGNARILFRKYMWRGFFTDRYEQAATTASLQDYRALREVLKGKAKENKVPCFDKNLHALPTKEAIIQASWPKKRDRLARAILQVSLQGGAHDIADDSVITRNNITLREYHHLYPVEYLRSKGSAGEDDIYRALNCALISWKTNRIIKAKEPLEYLGERTDASLLGEAEIRRRLNTHAISYKGLAACDYNAFLDERATTIVQAMNELCAGKTWQPK